MGERRSSPGDPPFLLTTPVRTAYLGDEQPFDVLAPAGICAFASDLRAARALPGSQAGPSSPRLPGPRGPPGPDSNQNRAVHSRSRFRADRTLTHYHLRYHLWAGVHRDLSGSNGTAAE